MPLEHTLGSRSSGLDGVDLRIFSFWSSGELDIEDCPSILIPHLSLATNIIVSTMLVLGGSATVTDLTGMNTILVSAPTDSSCAYASIVRCQGMLSDTSWVIDLCYRWGLAVNTVMRLVRSMMCSHFRILITTAQ